MRETLETIRAALKVDDPHGHYDLVCNALAERPAQGEAKDVAWLWTHCRALGMTRRSHSGTMRDDVALFVAELHSPLPPATPAGLKAVPVKLAPDMIAAVIALGDRQTVRAPNPDGLDRWAERDVNLELVWETLLATAPPSPSVPKGWREFIAECATFAGKMVNGNQLSERAAGLLAAAMVPS